MPMYEYKCDGCSNHWVLLRRIADRDIPPICHCGESMDRMISLPAMHVWEAGRYFPNVTGEGDGSMTFPTRHAYESHLKERGIAEVSTSAPIKRPHGNKVIRTTK